MALASRIDVPSIPNGKVQRKIPTPFQRPSVTIGGESALVMVKREWRNVLACNLREGDIIAGLGLVHTVEEHVEAPEHDPVPGEPFDVTWTITVHAGEDNVRVYEGHDLVHTFTPRG